MARVAYKLVWRPVDTGHGHPALVFDGHGRLHLPLITFAREATRRLSPSSVRVPLRAAAALHLPTQQRARGWPEALSERRPGRAAWRCRVPRGATGLRRTASPPRI